MTDREWAPGDRVVLVGSSDPYTRLTPGDTGVIRSVDDLGTVHVAWDPDGHLLGLIPGVDVWRELGPQWRADEQAFFEVRGDS